MRHLELPVADDLELGFRSDQAKIQVDSDLSQILLVDGQLRLEILLSYSSSICSGTPFFTSLPWLSRLFQPASASSFSALGDRSHSWDCRDFRRA